MKVLGMKKNLEGITKEMNEFSDSILTSEDPSNIDFILENSDFIVNCSPLTVETNQFFDLEKFKKMKKSACFINVGRGQSVKEQDLIKAVEEKEISGAVLDVFEEEPLPLDSPLWDFDNVFITPHSCELTQDSILARLEVFVENAKKFILDQNLDYVVDFEKGY